MIKSNGFGILGNETDVGRNKNDKADNREKISKDIEYGPSLLIVDGGLDRITNKDIRIVTKGWATTIRKIIKGLANIGGVIKVAMSVNCR